MIGRLARNPLTSVLIGVLAAGSAFGLYWFQPWKLVTSKTVNEALPSVDAPGPVTPSVTPGATAAAGPGGNKLLASGTLITHEHDTSGTVRLVQLADGRIQIVFENLSTSDGPDLRVWLTDQPVIKGSRGWHVFDDGRYVEVGRLKANNGNQVYSVPAGTEIEGMTSMSIWCKRFAVSFGAAELAPA